MYYLFIDENKIEKYNGEILKRYVGNKLVKVISNPTDEDLKDFTYLELVDSTEPEYNPETQYLEMSYYIEDGKIHCKYSVCENVNTEDVTVDDYIEETI